MIDKLQLLGPSGKPIATKARCTTFMKGRVSTHEEFVTVGIDPKKETFSITHNTNVYALSVCLDLIGELFKTEYNAMSQEDKDLMNEWLLAKQEANNGQNRD